MFYRACAVAIFLIIFVSSSMARPPKKLHYDEPGVDSYTFYDPEESPRPQPQPAVDDLALARQLVCEPLVIHWFTQAWKATLNGTRDHGLAETGFAIQSDRSSISIQGWQEASLNHLAIPADDETIAIAHVHGRGTDEHPASIDERSRVPNFVISLTALYVTVPNESRTVRIRGGVSDPDGWNKPCSVGDSVTAQQRTGA